MAEYIIRFIIYSSLLGGIISAALCTAARIFCKHLGARWAYAVSIAAAAAFILPLATGVKVVNEDIFSQMLIDKSPQTINDIAFKVKTTPIPIAAGAANPSPLPVQAPAAMQPDIQFTPERRADVYTPLCVLYIAAVLALLIRQLYLYTAFSKTAQQLSDADDSVREETERAARSIGFNRRIRLRTVYADITPFVTGIVRPILYLPSDGEVTELSLRHELMHCKRCDLLFKLAADIICTVQFYNPAAYFMRATLDKMCELSCDEAVAAQLDAQQKKAYSMEILALAKRSCPKIAGGAALIERKSDLTRRIEQIMEYKKKTIFTRVLSGVIAAVLTLGSVALAAETAASAPAITKATYTCNIDTLYTSYLADGQYQYLDDNPSEFDTPWYNDVCVYTSFLGKASFKASWLGFDKETQKKYYELIETTDGSRKYKWINMHDDLSNYKTLFEVELVKTVRRYGDNVGIEGEFDIRRNNDVIYDNIKGYIVNPPPMKTYSTDSPYCVLLFEEDGVQRRMTIGMRFEERTPEQAVKSREPQYYMNHSIKTKEITPGKLTKLTEYGQTLDVKKFNDDHTYGPNKITSGTIMFNKDLRTANIFLDMQNYCIVLRPGDNIQCTDDAVTGEFVIQTQDGLYSVDTVKGTLSGLSQNAGGTVEFKSDNGEWLYQAAINPLEIPKCKLTGTRDPSEFYTEGEEVFIGTPYQQDEYDKIHFGENKKVKRIVVDDNGKVIFTAPVEWQTKPNVIMQPGEQYMGTSIWQGVGGCSVHNADGTRADVEKVLIWDSYKQEAIAVIPPENQFWI